MRPIFELLLFVASFLGSLSSSVHGLKIPFAVYPRGLGSASDFTSTSKLTFAFGDTPAETLDNKWDVRYTTNITINGKEVVVFLDTGSTDLWVDPPEDIGQFNDTDIPIRLYYGDGSYGVSGTIGVSPFKFASYEVPRQAFVRVTNNTFTDVDKTMGIFGILGLSFDFGAASRINSVVKSKYGNSSTWGQSVLHNIFDQHPDEPNYIALSLSRTDDYEDTKGGFFSIGEYNSDYSAVSTEPQLAQFPDGATRWTALLEGVLVGGQSVPVTSTMKNVPAGCGVTLFDTGDPHAVFPQNVWDGIYSNIPGSARYTRGPFWIIPCNTTTIVEFVFGGKKYPIHPLDLTTISNAFVVDGRNTTACVSALEVSDSSASQDFEYSFGTSFLRNVYSAYHFGDSTSNGKPYMQFLSRLDAQKAVSQVVDIRGKTMASLPPEISPTTLVKLLGAKPAVHVASDYGETSLNGDIDSETVKKYGLIVIILLAANMVVGLVLLVLAVLNCMRRGLEKRRQRLLMGEPASAHYASVGLDDEVYSANHKEYGE